jgi:hypothetical protein
MTSTWYRQPIAELEAPPFGGSAAASTAYARGERNPTRLTDLAFYDRHPERQGRPIQRGETQLAQEWLRIRDTLVAPALRQAAAAPAPPPVVTAAPPVLPAPVYTRPPNPAQLLPPPRTNIAAMPWFKGDRVLDVETKLIQDVASRPDGWVYIANWYADLVESPELQPFANALVACALRGGTIRALFWDGSLDQVDPILEGFTSVLGPVVGRLVHSKILAYLLNKTHRAVNLKTANFINSPMIPNAIARMDAATLPVGSHHQKILVVGNNERTVAVVGGVDLNRNRIAPTGDAGTPYFDVSVQLDGQAAVDVAELFERRWRAAPDRLIIPLPRRRPPAAPTTTTGATVQIGVNFGCGKPLTDIPHPIRGASELIKNLLLNCRDFFYVEDQYGIGNDELRDAIRQAFANGARFGVVVLATQAGVDDMPEVDYWRHKFWTQFPQQLGKSLLVFERRGDANADPAGPHAYVHSKVVLVDDRAVSIASVNFNQRSWYYDSELAAVLTDAPALIRDLRIGLWSEHLNVSADSIRDPFTAFAQWRAAYADRMPRLKPLRFASVPPRKSDEIVSSPAASAAATTLPAVGAVFGPLGTLLGGAAGTAIQGGSLRDAIDNVMDKVHWWIFDPKGPERC